MRDKSSLTGSDQSKQKINCALLRAKECWSLETRNKTRLNNSLQLEELSSIRKQKDFKQKSLLECDLL